MRRTLSAVALLMSVALAFAGTPHLFDSNSLESIRAARQGRPFAMVLWSIDCTHCRTEMKTLAALKNRHPGLDLVFVSTDDQAVRGQAQSILAAEGLDGSESWIFGSDAPERLRWSIDPRWRGELPRTYLFDASHRVRGISGLVPEERLRNWLEDGERLRR